MKGQGFCVAFVGLGPKGLYGLERLAIELLELGAVGCGVTSYDVADWQVALFEPHPFPGAGPVYDPRQPAYLRMNFANRHVDLWSRRGPQLPFERPNLVEWLAEHHPDLADDDGFAPRSVVGEYLHAGFRSLLTWFEKHLPVTWYREAVKALRPSLRGWRVLTEKNQIEADEVLVATGHDSRGSSFNDLDHPRVIAKVFPVDRPGGLASIPAGAQVAIRGLGLTAIDATLALTEGRGGRFEPCERPGRFRYLHSHRECSVLLPFSRSGRPMMPKPACAPLLDPNLETLWRESRQRLSAESKDSSNALKAELNRAAECALRRVRGFASGPGETESFLDGLFQEPQEPFSQTALIAHMEQALEVALGRREPDAEWAFGAAWRGLYPAIVDQVRQRTIGASEWAQFALLAREMERIAFGPPAENAARYLALIEAGIVDLRFVRGPRLTLDEQGVILSLDGESRNLDFLIQAVLAPPGGAPESSSLLHGLLDLGAIRVLPWNGGLEIDEAGRCVGQNGEITPGLSMIGRPTEGCVLGNDTLSRTLHDTPQRWAQALVQRRLEFSFL